MFNDPSKLVIEQCSSLVTVTDAGSHHFQKVNYLWAENGSVMGVATLHVVACTTVTSHHHMGMTMLHVVACTIVTSHHCMGVAMLYVASLHYSHLTSPFGRDNAPRGSLLQSYGRGNAPRGSLQVR